MPFRCIGYVERDREKRDDLVSVNFDATARFIFWPILNSLLTH